MKKTHRTIGVIAILLLIVVVAACCADRQIDLVGLDFDASQ